MPSPDLPDALAEASAFVDSRFGPQAVMRLRAAFERSRHPMLIADDQRRWVTGNAAACDLLGLAPEDIPWRRMDEYTPPEERTRLEEEWRAFLNTGEAEGWYPFYVRDRGQTPLEFSATANVLPARHLSVFILPASAEQAEPGSALEVARKPAAAAGKGQLKLTRREREVMTLVASGHQTDEIAERLFVASETVKTHVHNAMGKLGAHTRAHAVSIALMTAQVDWQHLGG